MKRRLTRPEEAVLCSCGKPTRDRAFMCDGCLDGVAVDLRELQSVGGVPGLWDELTISITGQQGVDYRTVGVASPSDSTGIQLNERASFLASRVSRLLRAVVVVALEARVADSAPEWVPAGPSTHSVQEMASWLSWRIEGLAWHGEAVELLVALRAEIGSVRWVIDRPETRLGLGPCPAGCGGLLSAPRGATFAECDRCHLAVEAQPLRDRALEGMGVLLCTAAEIAAVVTELGRQSDDHEVPDGVSNTNQTVIRNRINQWAHRGHITPAAHAEDGSPRYRFGAVYDLLLEHERRHRHEFTDWREADTQPDPARVAFVRSCRYEGCPETQTKTKPRPKVRRTTTTPKGA